MKLKEIKKTVEIPEGIDISVDDFVVVKGEKGELKRKIKEPLLTIEKKDNKIILKTKELNRNSKRIVGTATAHIKNMMKGVKNGYVYRLKVCAGHFPMNVSIINNEISIKNFLGEKYPRTAKLKGNITAKIEKDIITVEGNSIEEAGQAAADIEKLTAVRGRDRRRFQDGIYIIEKPK